MKNVIKFMCIALLLSACTDAEPPVEHESAQSVVMKASQRFRTLEDAIDIAKNAMSLIAEDVSTNRSRANGRQIDASQPIHIVTSNNVAGCKSRSNSVDTLMYVVNYADSMGYAIISALKDTPDLIAVTIAGNYNPDISVDIPGFNFYMDNIKKSLAEIANKPLSASRADDLDTLLPHRPMPLDSIAVDTMWISRVPPRVNLYWGQHNPEGIKCPNGVSGCSNTAVAMLMSYFEYPKSLKLTYMSGDPVVDLNWEEIKKHKRSKSSICESCKRYTYPIHERISQLCRELGYMSDSKYEFGDPLNDTKNETGTLTENTILTLRKLGYKYVKHYDYKFGGIESLMDRNSILLVYGANNLNEKKGHMWLCDGTKCFQVRYRLYQAPPPLLQGAKPQWEFVREWKSNVSLMYYYNWGWGSEDHCGYFRDGDFKVSETHDYNSNVGYIKVSNVEF